jgi:pimeloyl-ACP methyl ester carboxylesterase
LVALLLTLLLVAYLGYVWVRYAPIIGRIFDETPVFAPARVPPEPDGEEVRFLTPDGLELAGTYLPARTVDRAGVIVFCPEFLGDRWSALLYADGLREAGFDLFTFDFRNHGDSPSDAAYRPLQWVSDLEVLDLRAAVAYLKARPDADRAGLALFGMSRGGGAALCVGAADPTVWAIATDGAFPTRGTMLAYILRWAEIYVRPLWLWRRMPGAIFRFASWFGRVSSQWRHGRRYPSLERAVARIAPRPWLMIHGEKDVYIGPEIALELFSHARQPKEAWIVPGAKHNRCRETDPDSYRDRIVAFFRAQAPRRLVESQAVGPADFPPAGVACEGAAIGVAASVTSVSG